MSNDVIEKGLKRLAYQFTNSEKFKDFIESFLKEFSELYDSEQQLLDERYLNTSVGVQLDGIGEIVGLSRPRKEIDVAGLFGFLDDPSALGFGDINNANVGGNFYDFGENTALIGDDLYRILIRAKIILNQTSMTVEDTLRLFKFVLGDDTSIRYILSLTLYPKYQINRLFTPFEESLIKDLPTLIGNDNVTYITYDGDLSFSFAEDTNGLGFGDANDSNVGGSFAKIIV